MPKCAMRETGLIPLAGAAQKSLTWRQLSMTERCSKESKRRTKEHRDRTERAGLRAVRGPISADVSQNTQPMVEVIDQLPAAIRFEHLRRRLQNAGARVDIEAHIVVTAIEFQPRCLTGLVFVLGPHRRHSGDCWSEQKDPPRVPHPTDLLDMRFQQFSG